MSETVATESPVTPTRATKWRNGLLLFLLHSTLWLVLSGNKGWLFGACFVIAATFLSLRLGLNLAVVRFTKLPAFIFFYFLELLSAGWQVAFSACRPKMPIEPDWVSFVFTSRYPRTHMLLATFICLLPGTLASRVQGNQMRLHLLNAQQPWRPTVEKMEVHLMALLGENEP